MEVGILLCVVICIVLLVIMLIRVSNGNNIDAQISTIVEQNRNTNMQLSSQIESLRQQMAMFENNIRTIEENYQKENNDQTSKLYDEMNKFHNNSNAQINEINSIVTEKMQAILDRKLNDAFAVVVNNMNNLGNSLTEGQEKQRKEISAQLEKIIEEFFGIREDNQKSLDKLREDNQKSLDKITQDNQGSLEKIREAQKEQQTEISQNLNSIKEEFAGVRKDNQESLEKLREDNQKSLEKITQDNQSSLERIREVQKEQQTEISQQLNTIKEEFAGVRKDNQSTLDKLREDNQKSLDKINDTVNEKLQKTLNDRISQSFEAVNQRLAEVYAGLGEMKTVASGVSDLKNVLANVKNRGIMGEIQLSAILNDILAPNQYEEQYRISPDSKDLVDFAVRLPGQVEDEFVYLPIDSKFPGEKWAALAEAYDVGNPDEIKVKRELLTQEIKRSAKSIHDKYIIPPYSTDFAIMFLPFEGLYAEVVNMQLVEQLQRDYHVNITGPSTMAAMLNSLQMGFRTLAIQKKSGEVWKILEAAKAEFSNFGTVLESARKRLRQADDDLDKLIGTRTRAINRKLKTVTAIDKDTDTEELLDIISEE